METTDTNGVSAEAHLRQVAKVTGQSFESLADLPAEGTLPELGVFLWSVYLQLAGTRSSGMMPNPISYLEIDAWCRLHHSYLSPWEVDALKLIDSTFFKVLNGRLSRTKSGNSQ